MLHEFPMDVPPRSFSWTLSHISALAITVNQDLPHPLWSKIVWLTLSSGVQTFGRSCIHCHSTTKEDREPKVHSVRLPTEHRQNTSYSFKISRWHQAGWTKNTSLRISMTIQNSSGILRSQTRLLRMQTEPPQLGICIWRPKTGHV